MDGHSLSKALRTTGGLYMFCRRGIIITSFIAAVIAAYRPVRREVPRYTRTYACISMTPGSCFLRDFHAYL